MKIALQAPIENSGWGRAAKELFNSLALVPGFESSLIPINSETPDCDIHIHFFLPQSLKWKFSRKSICYFFYETDTIQHTVWSENLSIVDEIWVATRWQRDILLNDGIKTPIKVVPIPVDISKYFKKYKPIIEKEGEFLFYWIGDLNLRKNLPAAIRAFHLEFEPHEPVNIVVKASKLQVFHNSYKNGVREICNEVKKGLKLYNNLASYKEEIIMPESEIPEEEMLSLHQIADCFLSTSRGEGLNIPCLDALGFGNTPIVTGWSGHTDFINKKNGWLTDYNLEYVHGMNEVIPDLYSGQEKWVNISVEHLRKNMRECYENSIKRGKLSGRGKKDIYQYSYHEVARQIYEQQNEREKASEVCSSSNSPSSK